MFLRRAFPERDSEVVFGLVFVPFGWPFSLPLISVSQRNPSRVLKFFCLSNRLCFCGGMCLAMCFLSFVLLYFEAVLLSLGGYWAFIFTVRFLHRNYVAFSDFFAVTSTLKGKECWQTWCFPTLKNNFLRFNSLFCDEGLAWRLRSSKNCFEHSRSWFFLLPNRTKIAFAERCVSRFLCPM